MAGPTPATATSTKTTVKKEDKTPKKKIKTPTLLNKRPSPLIKEGEKPTEQEIAMDVLAIKALRRRMLRSTMIDSPYKDKLEKYKSMTSSSEMKEVIDELLEQFQIKQTGGDTPGTKHSFEETHRKEGM